MFAIKFLGTLFKKVFISEKVNFRNCLFLLSHISGRRYLEQLYLVTVAL